MCETHRQPYYIHPASGGTLSLAGLYELSPDPEKEKDEPNRWLWTMVITTDATGPAASTTAPH